MKKSLLIFCLSLFAAFSPLFSIAQDSYQPGFAILNDGTRISGLIKLYHDAPWFNQRFIYMKDSAAVAASTNGDAKSKKYKVADLKFYQVGDRKFAKVHYVDVQNLQFKTLGANDHMLEVLSSGKINSYRYYSYPPDVEANFGTEAELQAKMEKEKNDLLHSYKILTNKDNEEKFNDAFDYDLQIYFKDTPEVLEKYQQGAYGNEPVTPKKGLAAKMMAMARKAAFKPKEAEAIIAAFNEYNTKKTQ